MTTKHQDQALSAYRSTLNFFETHTCVIAPELPTILARLARIVREIDTLRGEEYRIRNEARLKMLETPLHEMREQHMLPLSRLARRVFKGESALLAAIRVPHKRDSADDMIAAALRIVETLTPHRNVLRKASIDPTRLTRLKAQAKALDKLARNTQSLIAERGGPGDRLEELYSSAHDEVFSLQALVRACPAVTSGDKDSFAACSRIGKLRGRPSQRRQANAARKRKQ